ncbi:hypothetical protein ACHQM5_016781 [Ranunculus cassubicifolius]
MREMTEQILVERRAEEAADKDKKKKRRSNRRGNKLNSSNSVCSSSNGANGEETEWGENATVSIGSIPPSTSFSQECMIDNNVLNDREFSEALSAGFSSFPPIHIHEEAVELGTKRDQFQPPNSLNEAVISRSCPEPVCHEEINGSYPLIGNGHIPNNEVMNGSHPMVRNGLIQNNKPDADMQRNYFVPYWSANTVNEAIQKGEVFMASFRVNAHNRLEAYCTIDGLPIDVFINGVHAQNRAVEGDTVAVKLDSLAFWTKLKGSAGQASNGTMPEGSIINTKIAGAVGDKFKAKDKVNEKRDQNSILSSSDSSNSVGDPATPLGKIRALIKSYPTRRPTGTVVAIIQKSPRRESVIGFLGVRQWLSYKEGLRKDPKKKKNSGSCSGLDYIQLIPNDAKFPNMLVSVGSLPDCIKKRLIEGDSKLEMELVAARIDKWCENNHLPLAHVMHTFGRGGEIEPQVAAILFENAIYSNEFSPESLSCLPDFSWEVPVEEFSRRKDLTSVCTITIDPSTATDLDDALSIQRVSNDIFRVGVHIADVSHFVLPDTPLDIEAQTRSTSVYLRQHKLRMLPSVLSENIGSLLPGVDRLAFSIVFDCNLVGDVVDRWIGRTVIRSCCKLSYQHAQDIIDGSIDPERQFPELYGQFGHADVIESVKRLYEISKRLRENRFCDGAIHIDNLKPFFLLDEHGIPYDSLLSEQKDSDRLVEEFMLLANRTAAEVISRAYPDCALLRRHPEPNERKLKEFEAFCRKHGLELDTSTSGQFNLSLEKIREKLRHDPVLFGVLISYALKPMQAATYFCTGDLKDRENEWCHYALATPLYTHFTSPLRRYADILVHRTLSASIEVEERLGSRCFSRFPSDAAAHILSESKVCREALAAAALKHRIPCMETVAEVAAYCNEKMMATRRAEEAGDKLYMWALLKKKETLIAEARVLGLGPKFMSVYIHKLAIERRIHYDEVEGLSAEWLENTSTLLLSLCSNRRSSRRGGGQSKFRPLEDVALVLDPFDAEQPANEVVDLDEVEDDVGINEIEPALFPLTVRILSTVYVALHAVGGDDGPLEIGARLYTCSYSR